MPFSPLPNLVPPEISVPKVDFSAIETAKKDAFSKIDLNKRATVLPKLPAMPALPNVKFKLDTLSNLEFPKFDYAVTIPKLPTIDVSSYLDGITSKIEMINDLRELQSYSLKIDQELNNLVSNMQSELAFLAPLMIVPSINPTSLLTWIKKVINQFTGPYIAIIENQVILATKIPTIVPQIQAKISSLGGGIGDVTLPSITLPTIPEIPSLHEIVEDVIP